MKEKEKRAFWLVEADGGFTSVGVVVALALTLALLFTTSQVYWINSVAGEAQFTADAAALAAEDVVAEYYVVAQTADAVVLSLSLFGLLVYGVAIVVSCIPYCQEVGAKLMDFGQKVFKLRDDCAKQASEGLLTLQKALPYLAAANAISTIEASNYSNGGSADYHGLAILVPWEGEEPSFPDDDETEGLAREVGEQNEETSQLTDKAEEARKEMDEAKLEGYLADCGANPSRCLYERAGHLAGLSGTQNPWFASIDSWEFDYALDRAKAYYRQRRDKEAPANQSFEEQMRSYIRKQFYVFAVEEMSEGYSYTDAQGVYHGLFPLLPRNTSEIRQTRLYTEEAYFADADGVLHGTTACPAYQAAGAGGWGSLAQLESGAFASCDTCGLSASSVGRVASASTSIDTGFEYHYRIVAAAAARYATASREYVAATGEAKDSAEQSLDSFEQALAALDTPRINPKPPGRNGCIAIVFDFSSHALPGAFSSSFVAGTAALPPRVAISAAALVRDAPSEGNTILSSLLDRVRENSSSAGVASGLGIFDGILGLWGDALLVYSEGVDGLSKGVGSFLRSIPLVKDTPLASWAEGALTAAIRAAGLEGVDLSAPKPVIVNSIHVIRASDSQALALLGSAKEGYSSLPGYGVGNPVADVFDGVLVELEQRAQGALEGEITLFTIRLGDWSGAPSIPITIQLPPQLTRQGSDFISDAFAGIRGFLGGG